MGRSGRLGIEEDLDISDPHTGDPIRLRPIFPSDVPRLQAFHRTLSPTVVHLRFHGYLRELPDSMARRFCTVDGMDRVALVAVTGEPETIVGVGRFDRLEDGVAEVAFVLQDAYQRLGIGSVLLERLVALARKREVHTFLARLLPGNTIMRRLLERTGYPLKVEHHRGEDELWLALVPPPAQGEIH